MSLKTRLDGRSEENASFMVKDSQGNVLAEVKLIDKSGSTFEISTRSDLHIEKPNGWVSNENRK